MTEMESYRRVADAAQRLLENQLQKITELEHYLIGVGSEVQTLERERLEARAALYDLALAVIQYDTSIDPGHVVETGEAMLAKARAAIERLTPAPYPVPLTCEPEE
jgi:hypothetical protein